MSNRLAANCTNALKSTGPNTADGKASVSRNALRHGILSNRMFLDNEDPAEFEALQLDLQQCLQPVGVLELGLVEKIAVNMWRQRRLVSAEAAAISLNGIDTKVAEGVSTELCENLGSRRVGVSELRPFDRDQEAWCETVVAEIENLEEIDLRKLEASAPKVFAQLVSDADDDNCAPESFLEDCAGGLTGYVAELLSWCRKQLADADRRPHIIALAEQVRTRRLVLPSATLELFARYQTTLDNQLFKVLKALRDAQEWRLKTFEGKAQKDDVVSAVA